MLYLTRQQRTALVAILGLLLTGWAVKAWRVSHSGTRSEVHQSEGLPTAK